MSVPRLRHDDSLSSDDNPEHHTPVTPISTSDGTPPVKRRTSSGGVSLFRRLSALSARISLTAPANPRALVWAETRVLPEKCIALEIQARKDLVALSLDDDDANPESPASFAAIVKRSDKSLGSLFCLGVKATSPGGIVRELICRAAKHSLVPTSHRFKEQCVDAMLREDADDEELERQGSLTSSAAALMDLSFVSSASTVRLAPRGDMGTASPWERAINGRGFIVAVAEVPNLTRRVVIVGRLKTPSLLGVDSCVRVRLVALALSGADAPSPPPAKTCVATAHTVATLLNDDAFFSTALRANDARDMRAAVLTFVDRKSSTSDPKAGPGEVDPRRRTPPPLHPTPGASKAYTYTWPFASVVRDVRYRAPHYVSDWTDAFKDTYSFSKTVNATAWLYFSTLAPALALGVVLREETNGAIGPTEVLLAEGVGNMAFSLIAGSPLLVLRVTGTAVAWVKILATWFGRGGMFEGEDFLAFHAAVGAWCAAFVVLTASVGGAGLARHAGSFTQEILAALVSGVFIRGGVGEVVSASVVTDEMDDVAVEDHPAFFLKHLVLFLGTFYVARAVLGIQRSVFMSKTTRTVFADMAPAISLVSLTALSYVVSPDVDVKRANITDGTPMPRAQLWASLGTLSPKLGALAAVPGFAFAAQVFVESNAASILTAAPANCLVKGAGRGLHLDMLGVGCVIAASVFLSCPMPMGTIPHSPQHARVLATVVEYEQRGEVKSKVVSAIETRVANFVSHALIVLTILLGRHVLSVVPTAVLSGYMCYTGWSSLESNGMFKRGLLAVTARECHPSSSYIRRAPLKTLHLYTAIQSIALLGVFAVETNFFGAAEPASDGFPLGLMFPVALLGTILVKAYVLPFVPAFSYAFLSAVNGRDDSEFFY